MSRLRAILITKTLPQKKKAPVDECPLMQRTRILETTIVRNKRLLCSILAIVNFVGLLHSLMCIRINIWLNLRSRMQDVPVCSVSRNRGKFGKGSTT